MIELPSVTDDGVWYQLFVPHGMKRCMRLLDWIYKEMQMFSSYIILPLIVLIVARWHHGIHAKTGYRDICMSILHHLRSRRYYHLSRSSSDDNILRYCTGVSVGFVARANTKYSGPCVLLVGFNLVVIVNCNDNIMKSQHYSTNTTPWAGLMLCGDG